MKADTQISGAGVSYVPTADSGRDNFYVRERHFPTIDNLRQTTGNGQNGNPELILTFHFRHQVVVVKLGNMDKFTILLIDEPRTNVA